MYKFLRSMLFWFEPEQAHYFSMGWFRKFSALPVAGSLFSGQFHFDSPTLRREVFGLSFKNPVGLAAGFDKNASFLAELEKLGFGHLEIGTVTPMAQKGNERPRLFRLPEDKALLNRMGFNNDGVEVVAERLRKWDAAKRRKMDAAGKKGQPWKPMIIGGNIGKNKDTPNQYAHLDYEKCFKKLYDYVDYFTVNVSSPNTPGLRELQEADLLKNILTHLQAVNEELNGKKPILVKIAPDLSKEELKAIAQMVMEIKLDGIVAANTTLDRSGLSDAGKIRSQEAGAGGISGKPVEQRSTEMVRQLYVFTKGQIPIIASGGVFTAEDAREKFDAGATLVQVWTGLIYEGPSIVKNICKSLAGK